MDNATYPVNTAAALAELDRVKRVVRSRSRWYGHFLLILGGGTVGYYVACDIAGTVTPARVAALALGWSTFVVALAWWGRQQPVTWHGDRRLRAVLMAVYFALVGATLLVRDAIGLELPASWLLGIVPALPCLVGAWMVLRR